MFAYPLPSIPSHFQPILIENLSNPIGIDPKSIYWRSAAEAEPINYESVMFDMDPFGRLRNSDG